MFPSFRRRKTATIKAFSLRLLATLSGYGSKTDTSKHADKAESTVSIRAEEPEFSYSFTELIVKLGSPNPIVILIFLLSFPSNKLDYDQILWSTKSAPELRFAGAGQQSAPIRKSEILGPAPC